MKKQFSILILSFVFLSGNVVAQKYNFINYNVEEGLVQSQATSICQDKLGYMWFGTLGGICKFNGKTFTRYTKSDGLCFNAVNCLLCDSKGNIWIGTQSGLSVFDGRKFNSYKIANAVNNVKSIQETQAGIYLLIENSIYKFEQNKLVEISRKYPTEKILSISTDEKQNLWSVNSWQQIKIIESDTERTFLSTSIGLKKIFFTLQKDTFLITDDGLYKFIHNKLQKLKNTGSGITSAFPDDCGNIWCGTRSGGFVFANDSIRYFNGDKGFTNNQVFNVFVDKENNIWFATNIDGIYKFHGQNFIYYDKSSGLENPSIMGIVERNNEIILGTSNAGLYKIEQHKIVSIDETKSVQRINCLLLDDAKNIWIGTNQEGLYCWKKNGALLKIQHDEEWNSTVTALHKDAWKHLWVATSRGVYILNEQKKQLELKANLQATTIDEVNKDSLIICTENGIHFYSISKNKIIEPKNNQLKTASAICFNRYKNFWFIGTTDDGLLIYNSLTNKTFSFTEKNGVAGNFIYHILIDKNNVWLGTGYGISKLAMNADFSSILKITNYTKQDGLPGMECNHNSALKDSNGNFWFGMAKGLANFRNDFMLDEPVAPLINLHSVKLFSKEISDKNLFDSLSNFNEVPIGLRLSPSQNHLTFEFDGLYFINPEKVLYKYQLEGLDKNYTTTENNFVVYSSLPSGKYKLVAYAMTKDGIVSKNKIEYTFEITTPFYKQLWFIILMILFLVGIGILIPYWRLYNKEQRRKLIQRLREEEFDKLRKRTAEDFHDEMGNKLTRISILSDVLISKKNADEQKNLIEQIKENVQALYRSSKDIIWSLNPEHDDLKSIAEHICEIGVDFFSNSKIEFDCNLKLTVHQHYKVPLDFSRNLQMIAKEIFNNCIKHSQASKLEFKVEEIEDGFWLIQFIDNGKGITEADSKGNGLKNIKIRAERIGAAFDLQSNPSGTIIQLKLKPNQHFNENKFYATK